MTLEKAKEELIAYLKSGECINTFDFDNALKLGREALKQILAWRYSNDGALLWDLPGETED